MEIPPHLLIIFLFQAHEDNELDNHTDTDSGISDIENLGSPFSQNSGGQSPQHEPPHSPCPSSTQEEEEGDQPNNVELKGEEGMCPYDSHVTSNDITKIDDDTAELMEFEDVIRDVANRHQDDNTNAFADANAADFTGQTGGLGFQEFQDFYDSELAFDGDSGAAQIVEYGPEYGPQIPEELAGTGIPDLEDHGAIQYELMHMDEQLLNLDYNIEDLDEAFLKMDEEIAKTISEDEPMINGFNDIFDSTVDVNNAWVDHQAYADIPELLELNAAASSIGPVISPIKDSFHHQSQGEELLNEEADPNFDITSLDKLEAMDESLENFDLGLLEGSRSVLDPLEDTSNILVSLDDSEEDILRNDVLLSHSLHADVVRDNSDIKDNLYSQVMEILVT